ncbi:MAG: hypothetical protein WC001_00140 [Desulfurivibrionaceae bacterium]
MTILPTTPMRKWSFPAALLLLAATLGGLGFYIFCSYQAFFNSDAAIANILAEEIVRTGTLFPKDWWYVNDDLWVFYKHLLLIPWVMAGENGFFAHAVSVSLVIVTTMLLLAGLLRSLGLSKTAAAMGCVVIGLGFSPLYLREVYGEAAYTWYFAFLLAFFLLVKKTGPPAAGKFAGAALTAVFLGLLYLVTMENPVRFLVYYVVPFALALAAFFFLEQEAPAEAEQSTWRELLMPRLPLAAAGCGVILLGAFSHKLVFAGLHNAAGANHAILIAMQKLPEHVAHSFLGLMNFIGAEWGAEVEMASLAGVTALLKLGLYPLALVLPAFYAWKNLYLLDRGQRFFLLLSYLGFALIFFIYSISSLHDNAYAARNNIRYIIPYLMMLLLCPVLLWRFFPKPVKAVLLLAMLIAALGSWRNISPPDWRDKAGERRMVVNTLQERGLSNGYAPYWESHVYTVFSKGKVRIRPLDIDCRGVDRCLWLTSDSWHEPGYTTGRVFVLVPKERLADWAKGMRNFSLAPPVEEFTLANYQVLVFAENPLPGLAGRNETCD